MIFLEVILSKSFFRFTAFTARAESAMSRISEIMLGTNNKMAEKIRPISGFANHPIDLFGAKAESENLLSLIESVTGLKYCDGDAFLRRICRNF